MKRLAVHAVAIAHAAIVLGCIVAVPWLTLDCSLSWSVRLPLIVFVVHLFFDPSWVCPLTVWENRLRRRAGMAEIDGWLSHYLIRPVRQVVLPRCENVVASEWPTMEG